MECHSRNVPAHHRLWQVQVTRQTQPPDYCNHVVVDAAHKDIRYLGSFSKSKFEQTKHMLTRQQTKYQQLMIFNWNLKMWKLFLV